MVVALCVLAAVDAKVLSTRTAYPATWTQGVCVVLFQLQLHEVSHHESLWLSGSCISFASHQLHRRFAPAQLRRARVYLLGWYEWTVFNTVDRSFVHLLVPPAVSDPRSPKYQNFMTPEQILEIVAPPKAEHDQVVAWLKAHGARNIKSHGDALDVHTNVAVAERLFGTKFFHFTHKEGMSSDHSVTRSKQLSVICTSVLIDAARNIVRQFGAVTIPDELGEMVHMVAGLSEFPIPHYRSIPSPLSNGTFEGSSGGDSFFLKSMLTIGCRHRHHS